MLIYGHRGAKREAPENTLGGFAYAYSVGVRAFELDVHLSSDEQLVVIHDDTVDRTTNATGPVAAFTADALRGLDARAAFPNWPERMGVPTLATVLDAYGDRVRFAIEIKRDAVNILERVCALLVGMIAHYDIAARVTVSSFDRTALMIMHQLSPGLSRAFIGAYDTPWFLNTAIQLECTQIDVPLATGSVAVVREAHKHGLRVIGWPGNTPDDLRTLSLWGVDGITTDYPRNAYAFFDHSSDAGVE